MCPADPLFSVLQTPYQKYQFWGAPDLSFLATPYLYVLGKSSFGHP